MNDLLCDIFADDVIAVNRAVELSDRSMLCATERAIVSGAVEKRIAQFSSGRRAAKEALARLGVKCNCLLRRDDRCVQWPAGSIGSISHSGDVAAAVVAEEVRYRGLGIDIEAATPLRERLWESVLTIDDRQRVESAKDSELMAKIIFSGKEAAYKAQYCVSETYLWFSAMHMRVDFETGELEAEFCRDVGAHFCSGERLHGRFRQAAGYVATGFSISK